VIKYRTNGAEHLSTRLSDEAGILYCSVHLPLAYLLFWGFLDLGFPPDLVLAAPSNITADGRWVPAGKSKGVEALPPGATAFLRARTVLREGGRFASMADEVQGGPLKPQMMRLAGRLRARVVLCWAEMDDESTIWVNYETAPFPTPDTEAKVRANLNVLERKRHQILAGLNADGHSPSA
jgi:hypothetical protein